MIYVGATELRTSQGFRLDRDRLLRNCNALTLILVTSIVFVCRGLLQFFRFKKPREVQCPETNAAAIVQIDVLRAAVSGILHNPVYT